MAMKEGKGAAGILAGSTVFFLVLFCLFLLGEGLPVLFQIPLSEFLFGGLWAPENDPAAFGILPMIAGTCLVTAGAVLFSAPLGVLSAVYLTEYCPAGVAAFYRGLLAALAGLPSVVYGFWGMLVLVPLLKKCLGNSGYGLPAAVLLLSLMLLPTVMQACGAALEAVPEELYLGARALGARRSRAIFGIKLPAAGAGIRTGLLLAVSRAMGETMAVSMVAGNSPVMPKGLSSGVRTLTSGIAMEMGYAAGLHRQVLYAMGVVLLGMTVSLTILRAAGRGKRGKGGKADTR